MNSYLQIRAELDAYYARLYGLTRDELRYTLRVGSTWRRFPWRNIPRAEGEGSPLVWGVSDEEIGVGGVGWAGERMKDEL